VRRPTNLLPGPPLNTNPSGKKNRENKRTKTGKKKGSGFSHNRTGRAGEGPIPHANAFPRLKHGWPSEKTNRENHAQRLRHKQKKQPKEGTKEEEAENRSRPPKTRNRSKKKKKLTPEGSREKTSERYARKGKKTNTSSQTSLSKFNRGPAGGAYPLAKKAPPEQGKIRTGRHGGPGLEGKN